MKNESAIILIEHIINKKLNQYLNCIYSFINNLFSQFKPNSKKNSSALNLKAIKTIQNDKSVNSMLFLRNGKLISGGHKGMAVYHRHTFQSDFIIQDHYYVLSILIHNFKNCQFNTTTIQFLSNSVHPTNLSAKSRRNFMV